MSGPAGDSAASVSAEGTSLGRLLQRRGDAAAPLRRSRRSRPTEPKKADVQPRPSRRRRPRAASLRYQGAVEQFERAVALAPENFEAHYELAKAFTLAGRPDAARTHLLEARRLAPQLRFRDP